MGCIHANDTIENNENEQIEFDDAVINPSSKHDDSKNNQLSHKSNESKPKPKPEDLIFIDRNNEVLVKREGSVNNEAFMIDGCNNCNIFICDTSAQIMIDYCKQSNIFIAPCEGSIFLRNCEECQIVALCQVEIIFLCF